MEKVKKQATVTLELELEVRDKEGKITEKRRIKANSLLRNFAQTLVAFFAGTSLRVWMYDTGYTNRNLFIAYGSYAYAFFFVNAGATVDYYGIQVGSGVTTVSRDDYRLATPIVHGSGSGQLSYGATTIEDVNGTPPQSRFRVLRTFSNDSGAAIIVYEIGLVYRTQVAAATFYNIMIGRDVLPTPVNVPAGSSLTTRYIFAVTA